MHIFAHRYSCGTSEILQIKNKAGINRCVLWRLCGCSLVYYHVMNNDGYREAAASSVKLYFTPDKNPLQPLVICKKSVSLLQESNEHLVNSSKPPSFSYEKISSLREKHFIVKIKYLIDMTTVSLL